MKAKFRVLLRREDRLKVLLLVLAILFAEVRVLAAQEAEAPAPGQKRLETARPELFPKIVASVNGSSINKEELIRRVAAIRQQMGLPDGDLPLEIYRTVLHDLVDIELLYQASREQNLEVSPPEVERKYDELVAQFPNEEAFLAQMAIRSATPEQVRILILKDLSVRRLIDTELASRVVVSEESKRQYYAENLDQMQQPEQLKLRHILASVEAETSNEDQGAARNKIEKIRREIVEEGSDFAALAREHSDDSASRSAGGEMTITRGQTVPSFEEAAFALEPGSVSEIVRTRFGYHIIQVQERIPAQSIPFEQAEPEIQQYLKQKQLQEEIQSELQKLRSRASIQLFL